MERRMLSPAELCDEVIGAGIKKGKSGFMQLLILGIFAGMFIALGGFAASMVSHGIDNAGLAKFGAGVVFPVGLMLVLVCGGELFTGNTLMSVALMEKKINIYQMLRNWAIVYFANFVGSFIIAFLVYNSGLLGTSAGKLGGYALKIASTKGGLPFWGAFSSGILCNILVCIAVWGAFAAKDIVSKVFIIWFPVMLFILSGFEHSIANMYYFSIALLAKGNSAFVEAAHIGDKISNVDFIHSINNLIPVTLGNIVGGAVFIGMAYWLAYKHFPALASIKASKLPGKDIRS